MSYYSKKKSEVNKKTKKGSGGLQKNVKTIRNIQCQKA